MTEHELFVELSSLLTGTSEADLAVSIPQKDAAGTTIKLYEIYLERLRSAYPSELSELLSAWQRVRGAADPEQALSESLTSADVTGERLRIAARQIVKIWFLSTIDDPRTPLDPKRKGKSTKQLAGDLGQYQQSAIWKLIGAPVPGYSNFPHGYWAEKPDLPQLP